MENENAQVQAQTQVQSESELIRDRFTQIIIPNGQLDDSYREEEKRYATLASDSEYIPIHSISTGERLSLGKNQDFFYMFNVPNSYYGTSRFITFVEALFFDNEIYQNKWLRMIKDGYSYYANRGSIIATVNVSVDQPVSAIPLMLMTIKSKYLFEVTSAVNTDFSKFCIIINRDFITSPTFYKIYRNIKKLFLDVVESKIDIVITTDINRLCYPQKPLTLPRFKTLDEIMTYTDSINDLVTQSFRPSLVEAFDNYNSHSDSYSLSYSHSDSYSLSYSHSDSDIEEIANVEAPDIVTLNENDELEGDEDTGEGADDEFAF